MEGAEEFLRVAGAFSAQPGRLVQWYAAHEDRLELHALLVHLLSFEPCQSNPTLYAMNAELISEERAIPVSAVGITIGNTVLS